jgi:transposase
VVLDTRQATDSSARSDLIFPRFTGHLISGHWLEEMESEVPKAYPREFRERAVELYRVSGRPFAQIAKELGVSETGLQRWVHQAEVDAGDEPGASTDDKAELAKLRRDVRRLEMENEILKRAAAYFAKENVLPKHLSD